MSRSTASTAVILALLTGLVLGMLGSFARPPAAFESSIVFHSPRAEEIARAFYDRMNVLLRTGERDLESTLAPGFIDHAPDGRADRAATDLIDDLLAARVLWPTMRVTVVSLDQHDSMIVARLRIEPGRPQTIPGVPFGDLAPLMVTEYLRVDGVSIAERWRAETGLPVAAFALQTALPWNTHTLTMPAIARIALEPGERVQIPFEGRAIVQVDAGSIRIDRDGLDSDGVSRAAAEPIPASGMRIVDAADGMLVRNIANDPALLWLFTVDAGPVSQEAPAVRISSFIPLKDAAQQGTRQRLSVTRLTLPPGAVVDSHETGIAEVIVAIEGTIEVTVTHGRAIVSPAGAATYLVDDRATLTAGDGISTRDQSTLGYHVTGPQPATVLVMRIDSAPPETPPTTETPSP